MRVHLAALCCLSYLYSCGNLQVQQPDPFLAHSHSDWKKDCSCFSFFITGDRMSRVCNVQYKLPWLNPHNVQKYKLFGVLKRLVHLKKKIVFFCSSLLLMLLQTFMAFLKVNLNFYLVLTQSYFYILRRLTKVTWNTLMICSWNFFKNVRAWHFHFHYVEKKKSCTILEKH